MIIPTICLERANFSVHPFGADDFLRYEDLAKEIYQILSDEQTLHFIPEKRLVNIDDAKNWLNGAILNFHNGRNAVHFITSIALVNWLGSLI